MPVFLYRSLGGAPPPSAGSACWRLRTDKSNFSIFKPSSLDVIFHDCKIVVQSREIAMLLRDNVYENLRSDILTCRLAPGDDMREQELAERYAVSRQPVREPLLRLEREHLVTVQPRQGSRPGATGCRARRPDRGDAAARRTRRRAHHQGTYQPNRKTRIAGAQAQRRHRLGHDPEKWEPVFRQDHAETKNKVMI